MHVSAKPFLMSCTCCICTTHLSSGRCFEADAIQSGKPVATFCLCQHAFINNFATIPQVLSHCTELSQCCRETNNLTCRCCMRDSTTIGSEIFVLAKNAPRGQTQHSRPRQASQRQMYKTATPNSPEKFSPNRQVLQVHNMGLMCQRPAHMLNKAATFRPGPGDWMQS